MVKDHIPLHDLVGCRIIRFMVMLPRPDSRTVRRLCQIPLFIITGIHQFHISAVLFRFLIQQSEYSLRACNSHDDGIQLL